MVGGLFKCASARGVILELGRDGRAELGDGNKEDKTKKNEDDLDVPRRRDEHDEGRVGRELERERERERKILLCIFASGKVYLRISFWVMGEPWPLGEAERAIPTLLKGRPQRLQDPFSPPRCSRLQCCTSVTETIVYMRFCLEQTSARMFADDGERSDLTRYPVTR